MSDEQAKQWRVGQRWGLPGGAELTVVALDVMPEAGIDRAYCVFDAGNNCTYGPASRETWTLLSG